MPQPEGRAQRLAGVAVLCHHFYLGCARAASAMALCGWQTCPSLGRLGWETRLETKD